MSLKPFVFLDDEYIENICRKMFSEWKPLTDKASSVAVMLWTSDGSEILEYTGDPSAKFNWCNLIGIGNPRTEPKTERDFEDLHIRPVPYSEHMHDFTYADLKRVISTIKRVGTEMTGFDICVIETFDPGPEFAKSDFKFSRHTEISVGSIMGKNMWIHCGKRLRAESRRYAAYPNGIPEGTPFGEFLGKQFTALARDVGFDRIWLSNGFGFSLESWNCKGELFDGKRFDFAGAENVRKSLCEFWRTFSAEVGDTVIETRGSNLSAAMDISAHGCPINEIYGYNIIAPPNSPWAALNSRFGLELCGFLSRIAALPKNGFLFRYYIHDPWWYNSPWFDRYGRVPHDIYLPLATARLDENGEVTNPEGVNLLSADDSFGDMPERCPYEVIPHILTAYDDCPTSCGILTWLYPFESYCKTGLLDDHPDRIFMDDWFIESAIDNGLPISSVISDGNFIKAEKKKFAHTVLLCPVPENGSVAEKCVFEALEHKIPLILYGSTRFASEKLRSLLGVSLAESGLDGKFEINEDLTLDIFEKNDLSRTLRHASLVSDGGLYEIPVRADFTRATVKNAEGSRAYATYNNEAKIAWVRGSFPHDPDIKGSLPEKTKNTEYFPCASLLRSCLALFGHKLYYKTESSCDELPVTVFSDSDKGIFMTSYSKNTIVKTFMSSPIGAPVCVGEDAFVYGDVSETVSPRFRHENLALFIKQDKKTLVRTKYEFPGDFIRTDRRIAVSGLSDASVTIRLPAPFAYAEYEENAGWPRMANAKTMKYSEDGLFATAEHISGRLDICLQTRENRDEYIRLGYFDFKKQ